MTGITEDTERMVKLMKTDPKLFEKVFLEQMDKTIARMETEEAKSRFGAAFWAAKQRNRGEPNPVNRVFAITQDMQEFTKGFVKGLGANNEK